MTFSKIDANLPDVVNSSVATGDYNGNENLDLLITGKENGVDPIAKIYTGNGSGVFTEDMSANLLGVDSGSVATGDYDGNDSLDLLVTGLDIDDSPTAKIYAGDGSGGFTENENVVLPGVYNSSVAWGDYDGDDSLDLLITGDTNTGSIAKIYAGDGSGGFTEDDTVNLPGVRSGSVATGDYEGDGDLDLLITGNDGGNPIAKIYTNDGMGVFTENTSNLDWRR